MDSDKNKLDIFISTKAKLITNKDEVNKCLTVMLERYGTRPINSLILNTIMRTPNTSFYIVDDSLIKLTLRLMFQSVLLPISGFDPIRKISNELEAQNMAVEIAGAFRPDTNQIVVFVSNSIYTAVISNKPIPKANIYSFPIAVALHEMCHYFFANHPDDAYTLFSPYLQIYYTTVAKSIYNDMLTSFIRKQRMDFDLSEQQLGVIGQWLLTMGKSTETKTKTLIPEAINKLKQANINSHVFGALYGDFWSVNKISYWSKHFCSAYKSLTSIPEDFLEDVGFGQELTIPSEVIGITSLNCFVDAKFDNLYKQMLSRM